MLGAGLLGLAVAFKMYPLVLAPLLLRYAAQDRRTVIRWCLMFPLPFLAFATLMLATDGLPGLINPLKFQLSRPVEPWWVFYGRLIPEQFAADGGVAKVLRSGLVLVVVLAMAGKRPPSVQSLLRRCAIAVMLFVSMQVFYSPQWWQWIAVLVFPLVRTHRGLLPLVILADLLTYLGFPIFFDWHLSGALADSTAYPLRSAMVYLRALLWFGIVVVLVRQEFREQKPAPGESSVVR
jgi:lysylphosphatidylglycerol synthetase-like protein (DUF2156 family)